MLVGAHQQVIEAIPVEIAAVDKADAEVPSDDGYWAVDALHLIRARKTRRTVRREHTECHRTSHDDGKDRSSRPTDAPHPTLPSFNAPPGADKAPSCSRPYSRHLCAGK